MVWPLQYGTRAVFPGDMCGAVSVGVELVPALEEAEFPQAPIRQVDAKSSPVRPGRECSALFLNPLEPWSRPSRVCTRGLMAKTLSVREGGDVGAGRPWGFGHVLG
jgi:hypothetical protein